MCMQSVVALANAATDKRSIHTFSVVDIHP